MTGCPFELGRNEGHVDAIMKQMPRGRLILQTG
jgi:hypothetical protein